MQPPQHTDSDPKQRRIEKPWGWEIVWAEGGPYTGKLLHIRAGRRLSLQYHDEKLETQYLLSGRAILVLQTADGSLREIPMEPGKGYTICPLQVHRLIALHDTEIIEVSTPETGITVRLEDDYRRADETETMRSLSNRGWEPPLNLTDP